MNYNRFGRGTRNGGRFKAGQRTAQLEAPTLWKQLGIESSDELYEWLRGGFSTRDIEKLHGVGEGPVLISDIVRTASSVYGDGVDIEPTPRDGIFRIYTTTPDDDGFLATTRTLKPQEIIRIQTNCSMMEIELPQLQQQERILPFKGKTESLVLIASLSTNISDTSKEDAQAELNRQYSARILQ
jgi:hypothetical protein